MDLHDTTHHYGGNMDSIFHGLRYDGTTEPTDHLALFKNILRVKSISDEDQIMTKFFNTLRGLAIAWYQCATLDNPSWDDLQKRFLNCMVSMCLHWGHMRTNYPMANKGDYV